jgi:hypothetical protein
MGLKGFYPWMREKKRYSPMAYLPNHCHLPDGAKILVDVPTFFPIIRRIYTQYINNQDRAYSILLAHLQKYGNSTRMVFYLDGAAASKKETH